MRTASKENSEKIKLPLLFMLTRRMILFLFLTLACLILFYIVGNYQLFLDSSQKLILNIAAASAAALVLVSITGIIESILCTIFIKEKRIYYIIHMAVIFLMAITGAAFLIGFRIIFIISGGMQA